MHCTLFNHRAAQIQFPRATGNSIQDLGRQGRLAQKQRPLGRGEKNNKKNTKKTRKKRKKKRKKKTQNKRKKTRKKREKNAEKNGKKMQKMQKKKNAKNSRFFSNFLFYFKAGSRRSRFFRIFFVLLFRIFFVVVFPFCVGVLFSSYFFSVHLPLLRWGPVWTRGPEIECLVFCILARML